MVRVVGYSTGSSPNRVRNLPSPRSWTHGNNPGNPADGEITDTRSPRETGVVGTNVCMSLLLKQTSTTLGFEL